MNIKEAKEIIYNMEIDGNSISCKNCVLEKRENCVVNGKDCQMEAIYTVLNELNKKDKVIDMMAEQIRASDIDEDICKLITEPTECVSRDCKCENCIKEYFYNKVEIPEEN